MTTGTSCQLPTLPPSLPLSLPQVLDRWGLKLPATVHLRVFLSGDGELSATMLLIEPRSYG